MSGQEVGEVRLGLQVSPHTLHDTFHSHVDLIDVDVRESGLQLVVLQSVVGPARLQDERLLLDGEILPGVRRVHVLAIER